MYKEILTNPQNHDPNNFIYIVHAINYIHNGKSVDELFIRRKIEQIRTEGFFYCGSLIGKLDPKTAKRMFNGCKGNIPISQTAANGTLGFILDIPDDYIIQVASTWDLHSPNEQSELRKWVAQHKGMIESPLTLLAMTIGDGDFIDYNEMVLMGCPLTSISGVFYQDTDSKTEADGKLLGEMVSRLEGKEIPIIALPPSTEEGVVVSGIRPLEEMVINLFKKKWTIDMG